jgi:hypothetical protein
MYHIGNGKSSVLIVPDVVQFSQKFLFHFGNFAYCKLFPIWYNGTINSKHNTIKTEVAKMKALHTMKFVSNAIEELTKYNEAIAAAETYETAKNRARMMMGYINGLTTFLNTMICMENNGFTGEFSEVLDGWMHKMYQSLVNKAVETKQGHDVEWKLLQLRDEYEMM